MSRSITKHTAPSAPRSLRRTAIAAGAVAATAALTIGAPGTAQAASPADLAPFVPGAVPPLVITALTPTLNQGVAAWNSVPLVGSVLPATNTTTTIVGTTPLAPGWLGAGLSNTLGVTAPLGLGSLSSTTFGVAGAFVTDPSIR